MISRRYNAFAILYFTYEYFKNMGILEKRGLSVLMSDLQSTSHFLTVFVYHAHCVAHAL